MKIGHREISFQYFQEILKTDQPRDKHTGTTYKGVLSDSSLKETLRDQPKMILSFINLCATLASRNIAFYKFTITVSPLVIKVVNTTYIAFTNTNDLDVEKIVDAIKIYGILKVKENNARRRTSAYIFVLAYTPVLLLCRCYDFNIINSISIWTIFDAVFLIVYSFKLKAG